MSVHAAELIAFVAGCGLTASVLVGWLRDVRRDRDFWHRQYLATDEARRELVEILIDEDEQRGAS